MDLDTKLDRSPSSLVRFVTYYIIFCGSNHAMKWTGVVTRAIHLHWNFRGYHMNSWVFSSILIFRYLIFYGPSRSIVRHRARPPPISTQLIGAMGDHSLREWSQWKWYIKTPECRSTAFLGRAKREERIMNRTVDDVMGSGVVMSWAWNEK